MYVLVVFYNKEEFPEYEKLLDELKKIPDTIIVPLSSELSQIEEIYYFEEFRTVQVDVWKYDEFTIAQSQTLDENEGFAESGDYVVYISGRVEAYNDLTQFASQDVKNNMEAIPVIVRYTRKLLATISGDKKYEENKRSEIEYIIHTNLNKIAVIHADIISQPYPTEAYKKIIGCVNIISYYAALFYVYPYMGRWASMEVDCCPGKSAYAPQKCYLFIKDESENGEYKGNKYFVIDKPPKATYGLMFESKMIKVLKKMVKDIETIILEYNARIRS